MKPLFKIGLFFVGAVLLIFVCYAIIKNSFNDNVRDYADSPKNIEPVPVIPLQENGVDDPLEKEEVSSEDPMFELNESEGFEESEEKEETDISEFFITCVDGYVTILYPDRNTIFFETGIYIEDLPHEIRETIVEGRCMNSVEEIYNFLESYTS